MLLLWDTPGFGDSTRLAKRLAQAENPLGWFLSEVWDRYRDRAFWSSQQAVRNVRESADIVLYLVNAAEDPADAGYVAPEIRILQWIGKPVVVLLNQLGRPRPAAEEAADVARWREHLGAATCVRAVLPLDAFARCWVQEGLLLSELASAMPADRREAFERLRAQWLAQRASVFDASIAELARRLERAATDREPLTDAGWSGKVRELGAALGIRRDAPAGPKEVAMSRLAERLDADIRASADRLIALHDLGGHAGAQILERLAEHYAVHERLSEGKAATIGGIVTGALAGLKADLATGGLTFGAGLLAGGVLGALGAAGLARGYNLVRGAGHQQRDLDRRGARPAGGLGAALLPGGRALRARSRRLGGVGIPAALAGPGRRGPGAVRRRPALRLVRPRRRRGGEGHPGEAARDPDERGMGGAGSALSGCREPARPERTGLE